MAKVTFKSTESWDGRDVVFQDIPTLPPRPRTFFIPEPCEWTWAFESRKWTKQFFGYSRSTGPWLIQVGSPFPTEWIVWQSSLEKP